MNVLVQGSFTNKIIICLDKLKEFEFIVQGNARCVRNIKDKGIIAYFSYIEGIWNKEEKLLGKLTTIVMMRPKPRFAMPGRNAFTRAKEERTFVLNSSGVHKFI